MVKQHKPEAEELQILKDTKFLTLKTSVSKKIIAHLANIEREVLHYIQSSAFPFPEGAFIKSGKISKGDHYQGLPYFVLDFPRLFTKEQTFTFRTMLWWGHEFSCTLHLGGALLPRETSVFCEKVIHSKDLYFCIADTPWQYHFQPDNYLHCEQLNVDQIKQQINQHEFIKISRYTSLDNWDQYCSFTLNSLACFLELIA